MSQHAPQPDNIDTPQDLRQRLIARQQALRDGDNDAWQQFVAMTRSLVRSFALSHCGGLFQRDDVDDVVQQTYLKAWQNREVLDPDRGIVAWLHTVCLHEITALVRYREVAGRTWRSLEDPVSDGEGTVTLRDVVAVAPPSHLDETDNVANILETLSEQERQIAIGLVRLEGNIREMARAMSVPYHTLYSRVVKIREKIQRLLDRGRE